MTTSLANGAADAHHETLADRLRLPRPTAAKADLKKVTKAAAWRDDADTTALCIQLARKSRKEAAALVGLTEAQLSAQIACAERPQSELFRSHDDLRGAWQIAHAILHPAEFDVVVTINVKHGLAVTR